MMVVGRVGSVGLVAVRCVRCHGGGLGVLVLLLPMRGGIGLWMGHCDLTMIWAVAAMAVVIEAALSVCDCEQKDD
jgi:hypothetical protein